MLEYNKKEIYIQFRTSVPQTSESFRLQSHIPIFVTGQNVGYYFLGNFYEGKIPELKIEFSPHKRLNKT
jgi:hypothetical protein